MSNSKSARHIESAGSRPAKYVARPADLPKAGDDSILRGGRILRGRSRQPERYFPKRQALSAPAAVKDGDAIWCRRTYADIPGPPAPRRAPTETALGHEGPVRPADGLGSRVDIRGYTAMSRRIDPELLAKPSELVPRCGPRAATARMLEREIYRRRCHGCMASWRRVRKAARSPLVSWKAPRNLSNRQHGSGAVRGLAVLSRSGWGSILAWRSSEMPAHKRTRTIRRWERR